MTDRTTINVTKESHSAAGEVKDHYGETWAEVLEFYANHRGSVSTGGLGQDEPIQDVDTQAIAEQLKDEISMANVPEVEVDVERLINRIDDLETQLPGKVAQEVRNG